MAGNQNSGGDRPSAPQNNPSNVSATGGNGQMATPGQAARYIPGQPWGQGKATMEQQTAAPMSKGSPMPSAPMASLPPVTPLDAPTQNPNEPVTHGAPVGPGAGTEALAQPPQVPNDPDMDMVRSYFPMIEAWAMQPDSSQGTKDYVNYLRTLL